MAERPLRLLVVGCSWPLETFLQRLFEGLARKGVEVTIALAAGPDAEWLRTNGVKWLHAPTWGDAIPRRLLRLGGMALRAAFVGRGDVRLLRPHVTALPRGVSRLRAWYGFLPLSGRSFDVVYFPWNEAAITYFALYDLEVPVLVSCRGAQVNIGPHDPDRSDLRDGLRATFSRAAAVHCVSRAIEAEAKAYGLDPAKSRVIHPAVDPVEFSPCEIARDNGVLRIVTVGSLIWRKAFEYALRAVHALRERGVDVRLEIIGEGPERQRLLFTIEDLGLWDAVRLVGRLPPDQVTQRLRAADVFLLSSLSEGISNAALEAMACALPVVTTNCGGMAEAVTDGIEGFVVPVRDTRGMADALWRLAAAPSLREQMGSAARARIVRDFALDDQVRAFSKLLREAAQWPGG